MYEELVKRLRNRRICIQQSGRLDDFPLLQEAADAIEELRKKVVEWQEDACKWNNEYYHLLDNKPRWISLDAAPRTAEGGRGWQILTSTRSSSAGG